MPNRPQLDHLKAAWLVPAEERMTDEAAVSELDEAFHTALVGAGGDPEVLRCHHEVTERIRILRRLDFTESNRISATYSEHADPARVPAPPRGSSGHAAQGTHRDEQVRSAEDLAAQAVRGETEVAGILMSSVGKTHGLIAAHYRGAAASGSRSPSDGRSRSGYGNRCSRTRRRRQIRHL